MASHATIIPSQFSETVVLRVIGCGKIEFPSFEIEIDTSTAPVELRYLGSTNEWITDEQNEFQFLNVIPRSRNHRQCPDLSLKFNKPEQSPNLRLQVQPGTFNIHPTRFDFMASNDHANTGQFSVSGAVDVSTSIQIERHASKSNAEIEIVPTNGWLLLELRHREFPTRSISGVRRIRISCLDPSEMAIALTKGTSAREHWSFTFFPNPLFLDSLCLFLTNNFDASRVCLKDVHGGEVVLGVKEKYNIPRPTDNVLLEGGQISVRSAEFSSSKKLPEFFRIGLTGKLRVVQIDGENIVNRILLDNTVSAFLALCGIAQTVFTYFSWRRGSGRQKLAE